MAAGRLYGPGSTTRPASNRRSAAKPVPRHAPTTESTSIPKGESMNYLRRPKSLIAASTIAVAVAVGGVVAYAAADGGSGPNATPLEQLRTGVSGPDHFASANGLNPADAKYVF